MKSRTVTKQRRTTVVPLPGGKKAAALLRIGKQQQKKQKQQKQKAGKVPAASVSAPRPQAAKVRAPSLADQAYRVIRHRIITLQLAPGEWFNEREIAEEIGFGAMPLREAIDRLEQEGLVKTVPRRGHQVAPMTAKYVRDFFDVWAPHATTISRLAAIRATGQQALEIARAIEQCVAAVANPSKVPAEDLIRQSVAVFQSIVDIADNEHFSEIWRRLSGVKERIFMTAFKQDPSVGYTTVMIADIADAWRSRDPDEAVRATERYVMNARAQVLRLL